LSNITTVTANIVTTIATHISLITTQEAEAGTSITLVVTTNREVTEAEGATLEIGAEEFTIVVLEVAPKEALGTTNPGVTIKRNAFQIT
jgi:hypothetical protein